MGKGMKAEDGVTAKTSGRRTEQKQGQTGLEGRLGNLYPVSRWDDRIQ